MTGSKYEFQITDAFCEVLLDGEENGYERFKPGALRVTIRRGDGFQRVLDAEQSSSLLKILGLRT